MKSRKAFILAAGTLFLLSFTIPVGADPVPAVNHSPTWFGLLYPSADTPQAAPEGEWKYRVNFDYSNIYFIPQDVSHTWNVLYDLELAQLTFDARVGLGGGLEAGVAQPLLYMWGGFLDDPVMYYHRMFGFPSYTGEEQAPRNRFSYLFSHNGVRWNQALPYTVTNGDTTLWLKQELFRRKNTTASIKLLLQAPTASTTVGMGNGSWESGGVVILGTSLLDLDVVLAGGYVNPGTVNRGERLALDPYLYGNVDLDWHFCRRWSAIVQFDRATSPYARYGLDLMGWSWLAVTYGVRYTTDSGRKIEITMTEDLSFTAPDFTFHAGVKF